MQTARTWTAAAASLAATTFLLLACNGERKLAPNGKVAAAAAARAELARRGWKPTRDEELWAIAAAPQTQRDASVLTLLLDAGMPPEYRVGGDVPLLAIVAREGHASLLSRLLDAHVAVDARDNGDMTPLMWASLRARPASVRALLAAGADPNAQDVGEWTPLMFAAAAGDLDSVQQLLGAHATVDHTTRAGWSAPYVATIKRNAVLQTLFGTSVPRAPVAPPRVIGDLTLQPGILEFNNIEPSSTETMDFTLTLAKDRSPRTVTLRTTSPFRIQPESLQLFPGESKTVTLRVDAPPMADRMKGELRLESAVSDPGAIPVIATSVRSPAESPARDQAYRTFGARGGDRASREEFLNMAFWQAVRSGDAGVAGSLLATGLNPDRVIDDDRTTGRTTPLVHAVSRGDVEMVRTLLHHGASVSFQVPEDALWNQNRSPLRTSAHTNGEQIAALLREAGARE